MDRFARKVQVHETDVSNEPVSVRDRVAEVREGFFQ